MENVYKNRDINIDFSADITSIRNINAEWWSRDVNTARKSISFTENNEILKLHDSVVVIKFIFQNGQSLTIDSGNSEDITIENAESGLISVMLRPQFQNIFGRVYAHFYVKRANGQELDAGRPFTFYFQESALDQDLPELEKFYVGRIEDIIEDMRQRAEDLLDTLEGNVREIVEDVVIEKIESMGDLTGERGEQGLSAFEIAVENGFIGTEEDWLESLRGQDGADGVDGKQGVEGLSAFEVAVANGFVGTEEEWLESLRGQDGRDAEISREALEDLDVAFQKDVDGLRDDMLGIATERVEGDLSWITVEESLEGKVTDIKFEGRTFNNHWSDRREDFNLLSGTGIELNGSRVTVTSGAMVGGRDANLSNVMFKPSTQYTVIVNCHRVDSPAWWRINMQGNFIDLHEPRSVVTLITTPATLTANGVTSFLNNVGAVAGRIIDYDITIIEGDVRHLIENHTDPRTLVSSKPSEMRVVGQNILDINNVSLNSTVPASVITRIPNGFRITNNNWTQVSNVTLEMLGIERGKTYRFSIHRKTVSGTGNAPDAWGLLGVPGFPQFWLHHGSINPTGITTIPFDIPNTFGFLTYGITNGVVDVEYMIEEITENMPPRIVVPHQSQSQSIEALIDGTWQTPTLRAIMNGAQTLVADTIESDGSGGLVMVQRVGVLDNTQLTAFSGTVEGVQDIRIAVGGGAPFRGSAEFGGLDVTSNKLATQAWGDVSNRITMNNEQIRINLPLGTLGTVNTVNVRQYLIENNYEILVPLANPIHHQVRPINLDSFEPVTHVQITSESPVSPSTSFKIATSVGQRLGLVTQRVRKVESKLLSLVECTCGDNSGSSQCDCPSFPINLNQIDWQAEAISGHVRYIGGNVGINFGRTWTEANPNAAGEHHCNIQMRSQASSLLIRASGVRDTLNRAFFFRPNEMNSPTPDDMILFNDGRLNARVYSEDGVLLSDKYTVRLADNAFDANVPITSYPMGRSIHFHSQAPAQSGFPYGTTMIETNRFGTNGIQYSVNFMNGARSRRVWSGISWQSWNAEPTMSMIEKLCEKLDIDINELMEG